MPVEDPPGLVPRLAPVAGEGVGGPHVLVQVGLAIGVEVAVGTLEEAVAERLVRGGGVSVGRRPRCLVCGRAGLY